jgi:hypothetical protein
MPLSIAVLMYGQLETPYRRSWLPRTEHVAPARGQLVVVTQWCGAEYGVTCPCCIASHMSLLYDDGVTAPPSPACVPGSIQVTSQLPVGPAVSIFVGAIPIGNPASPSSARGARKERPFFWRWFRYWSRASSPRVSRCDAPWRPPACGCQCNPGWRRFFFFLFWTFF